MKYNREDFFNRQRELLERIKVLKRYYNKDIYSYIESLVNLDECILRDEYFLNEFGPMNLIYDIMIFNLTGRIYKLIDKTEGFDQQRMVSNNSIEKPLIRYSKDNVFSFDVVNCDFRRKISFNGLKDNKPSIILKDITDRSGELLADLDRCITVQGSRRDALIKSIALLESSNPKSISLFRKRDSSELVDARKQLEALEEEIERLKRRIITTKKYGSIESDVCNTITNGVTEDFGIQDEDFVKTVNRSVVKTYKYIDIIKRIR